MVVQFAGHMAYMAAEALKCRDQRRFTDVRLVCADGELFAHRLVLAAASDFLSATLTRHDDDGDDHVALVVADRSRDVVKLLLDFLYVGKMSFDGAETFELQQLVHDLRIDPENVRIVENNNKITTPMKRKASTSADDEEEENAPSSAKQTKMNTQLNNSGVTLRRRGRLASRPRTKSAPVKTTSTSSTTTTKTADSGYHDLSDVETWVCAICKKYDPVLPKGADPTKAVNTEWVGCDCDRWYHQFCTGLKVVDDSFNCAMVKLKCLPTKHNND